MDAIMPHNMVFTLGPAAHLGSLATGQGVGTIFRSSGIVRFVQGGVVKTFRWPTADENACLTLCTLTIGCSMSQDAGDVSAHGPWVIRTFDDRPDLWDSLKKRIAAPVGSFGFRANVKFIDDQKLYGLSGVDLVHALPADYPSGFVFAATGDSSPDDEDIVTLHYFYPDSDDAADYERPPSAVPVKDVQSVRHLPDVVQELENNLSIANIDMEDVHNGVPDDGIYRGVDQ